MISGKKCKDIAVNIALSISIKFLNTIHIIFWIAMSFDNLRVILADSNIKYEPIMKTLEANLSCDFKWTIAANIADKLSCNYKEDSNLSSNYYHRCIFDNFSIDAEILLGMVEVGRRKSTIHF